jgi:Flp pilus assembly protein TadG
MSTLRTRITTDRGVALIYVTVALSAILLVAGLATDSGRAYVVKAQLTKATDGAALAAARMLNSGDPRGEAQRVFDANFPAGYMGTIGAPRMGFSLVSDVARGENIVTVTGDATMYTSLMRIGGHQYAPVAALGEARRRMVDLSLVLDVSSSIGSKWGAVRDASRAFVDAFDPVHDRLSLLTFGNGAQVLQAMPSSRGFDKPGMIAAIPQNLPGGSTAMVQGLYRGWDELRSVPGGSQSTLRVLVLFTDGASNSVPGFYDAAPGVTKGLRTYDFPKNNPDPDGQTWNNPTIAGLYDTQTGQAGSTNYSQQIANWNDTTTLPQVQWLPLQATITQHRSSGIPQNFPLQSSSVYVNGTRQDQRRGLRQQNVATGRYPAQVFNINNAARNLVEIIAQQARLDAGGDYPIRIYTIGMGELVRYQLGTLRETSESVLMRMSNDKRSPDYDNAQLEGKFFFAAGAEDVGAAFSQLQNEIIRLSK